MQVVYCDNPPNGCGYLWCSDTLLLLNATSAAVRMTLVFVSHSGRDGPPDDNAAEQARRVTMRRARDCIVERLREHHRVWLYRERLNPGLDWDAAILSGVTNCEFAVVLLDTDSVTRPGYVLKAGHDLAYRRFLDRRSGSSPSRSTTRSTTC